MAEQDQNRNESATPHKKEEARKKGSVPKSLDANSWVVLFATTVTFYVWGARIANDELMIAHQLFANTQHVSFQTAELSEFLTNILSNGLQAMLPLFALLIVLAVLANFVQVGPVFSFFPLKPDLNRINPITGFKRIFSMKLMMESVKTVLKFVFLGYILYSAISAAIPRLLIAFHINPASLGLLLFPEITSLLFKLLLALAFVALIDLLFSRWDFSKQLRMSRREITDEHKRREGDPRVKSRLRELQREALKRAKSLGKVKDADVLITNPTHLAIAVKYDKEKIDAPIVLAKGAGFLAGRMREIARKNHVPVIENKALARALFHQVAIESAIPPEHFALIAKILFWAYSLKGIKMQARGHI